MLEVVVLEFVIVLQVQLPEEPQPCQVHQTVANEKSVSAAKCCKPLFVTPLMPLTSSSTSVFKPAMCTKPASVTFSQQLKFNLSKLVSDDKHARPSLVIKLQQRTIKTRN